MSNRLSNETSPYLLQHKDNPVDWYPWCDEAFERAKQEDKPIFLSIGYSACHWCHVFAHESFEDYQTAGLLNKYFISVKVDKEERPDIDSVYMSFCQAFTGSGGWPTSIFMTADRKPFFAGTYFPKTSQGGMMGFRELLLAIHEKWISDRDMLIEQSEKVFRHLNRSDVLSDSSDVDLTHLAVRQYAHIYDTEYGGFGRAPKFPTPHTIMFLLGYYERYNTDSCLGMAEYTLLQMYRGGLFDHIGFGFCRYSTDNRFLVPHFEKMLYDNALLILAYCKAYTITKKTLYLEIAEKTASYILREMTSPEGGFYSSQDADSNGEEGKYYLFTPEEITGVLGDRDGKSFNRHYDITKTGNFKGKNIPNLLKSDHSDKSFEPFLPVLMDYRKKRYSIHRDEKILTAWNGFMIAAMCELYLVSKNATYLFSAQNADNCIRKYLYAGDTLRVSFHMGKTGVRGFLDDYAAYVFALLSLYRATLEREYLVRAEHLCEKVISDFENPEGGFYLYSKYHEELILRPKETYDGAIPSGNSLMAYNFVRLSILTNNHKYFAEAKRQLDYLAKCAAQYPANHSMFLLSFLENKKPPIKITAVPDTQADKSCLPLLLPPDAVVLLLDAPTNEYPLKNGKTTYYICNEHGCLPPANDLNGLL